MRSRLIRSIVFLVPLFYISMGHMLGLPLPHFMHGTANAIAFSFLGRHLDPMFGALAMSLSGFCVVINALRLKLFKFRHNPVEQLSAVPTENNTIFVKGKETMTKTMTVEGMSCGHCSSRVEKALNAIDGVMAKVDLEAKTATVELASEISDDTLRKAIEDAGYEVTSIS